MVVSSRRSITSMRAKSASSLGRPAYFVVTLHPHDCWEMMIRQDTGWIDSAQFASARGSIDAAPAAVAPGQIPSCAGWRLQRHVVDAGGSEGVAAQQPRKRHPAAAPQSEARDCFVAIDRTSRQVAAIVADEWRQRMPVEPDDGATGIARQAQQRAGHGGHLLAWMFHGRDAAILCLTLRGSRAGN